jgi:hypothetical protein
MTHLDRAIFFTLAAYRGTRPVQPQDIHWMDGEHARFVDHAEAARRLEELADDGQVVRDDRGYWPKVASDVGELTT